MSQLTEEEKLCGWFQQDFATAHTADNSCEISTMFKDRIINNGLWPPRSPDLTPCDFYLWTTVKERVCQSNPHTFQELRDNIKLEITKISAEELKIVNENLLTRYSTCLKEEGRLFQHLL